MAFALARHSALNSAQHILRDPDDGWMEANGRDVVFDWKESEFLIDGPTGYKRLAGTSD